LVGLGLVMVFSASSALASRQYGDAYYFLKRQAFSAGLGICALIFLSHLPYGVYRRLVYPIFFGVCGLMLLVFVPGLGVEVGGARRWIHVLGWSFQPSEAAKVGLVMYMAYSISKKGEQVRDLATGYIPHMIFLGILVLLVLSQKDLGTVALLTVVTVAMLFVGGARLMHLAATSLAGLVLLAVSILVEPYRLDRLLAFLDPWADPLNRGFQIIHSFMAFGSGGILGVGVGDGKQKLFYLPEPHTDFILSVLGEEMGLLGVALTTGVYVLIFWRGMKIARSVLDPFGSLLAFGITLLLSTQVILNLFVVLGLVPTKGLPLPFISYGGSSLVVSLSMLGILCNIRHLNRRSST